MRTLNYQTNRAGLFYFAALLLLCFSPLIFAQERSVRPGINENYHNPDFETWQRRFESPGREVFDMADEIVDALQLKPGMHVADIGAGTGLFTRRFAKKLGQSGKVYAVDISAEFVRNIVRQAKQSGLNNIEGIVNTGRSTRLADNSIDLAFTCDTYHHFEYPQAMLQSIYKALKKNGRLVVIDFRKDPDVSSRWVMGHVRANRLTVRSEIEQAGFRYLKDEDMLQNNYFMIFRK